MIKDGVAISVVIYSFNPSLTLINVEVSLLWS